MHTQKPAAVLLLLAFLSSSCATVTMGRNERIAVDSSPAGADVAITCDGGAVARGVTPASISIPRRSQGCMLNVTKEGFESKMVRLQREGNARFWGNFATMPLVPLGAIGYSGLLWSDPNSHSRNVGTLFFAVVAAAWITDIESGARWEHTPAKIDVRLDPKH